MASKATLLSPLKVGPYTLANRILMAPLTRCRSTPEGVPTPIMTKYYGDRAEACLIVTEATLVSLAGRGYPNTPGIWSKEQAEAWKPITSAVQAKGGRMFCQLWHQGRTAAAALCDATPIGPSPLAFTNGFGGNSEAPREIATDEIPGIIEEYRNGARMALEAGFDGVELHAANGYLPNQFLVDGANKRTDQYGGSIENRCRFTLEAMQALVDVWGPERVGIRISPASHWQDIHDSDPVALFTYLTQKLNALGPLAYMHVVEPRDGGFGATTDPVDLSLTAAFIKSAGFDGPVFSAGGHDYASGAEYVAEGKADAIVYGRWFISNPDLVKRFSLGPDTPLNAYDRNTFYSPGDEGYNTYPTLA